MSKNEFEQAADGVKAQLEQIVMTERPDAVLCATLVFVHNQVVALAQEVKGSPTPEFVAMLKESILALERTTAGARKYMGWPKDKI